MRRFGEPPVAGRHYVERPGAYAAIVDGGHVLIVQWAGRYYLPGGGIDPGEGALVALHRECLEETGWRICVERRLGCFRRHVYASDLDLWLRKVCHIYLARPALRIGGASEPGHRAFWVPVETALALLEGEGERTFLSSLGKATRSGRSRRREPHRRGMAGASRG